MSADRKPRTLLLQPDAGTPNNPGCAVLHYASVLQGEPEQLAEALEALFERNHWPPAWRNGVFAYQHFHTRAHEALGVYAGRARVMLGGENGVEVTMQAGDVVVLPAGVGHCKLECDGRLGIVGAYPRGQRPDTCTPDPARAAGYAEAVAAVPLPDADPVSGPGAGLVTLWNAGGCAPA
jgi:uncharacterized protein YjlB